MKRYCPEIFVVFCFLLLFFFSACKRNTAEGMEESFVPFTTYSSSWADSIKQTLSLEEKISQLVLIRETSENQLAFPRWIRQITVSGIIPFSNPVDSFLQRKKDLQRQAKVPYFFANQEAIHLSKTQEWPSLFTTSFIENDSLVQNYLQDQTQLLKTIGYNLSLWTGIKNSSDFDPILSPKLACGATALNRSIYLIRKLQEEQILAGVNYLSPTIDFNKPSSAADVEDRINTKKLVQNTTSGFVLHPDFFNSPLAFPFDSLRYYLANNLQFNGLLFYEIEPDDIGKSNSMETALRAGTDLFIVSKNPRAIKDQLLQLFKSKKVDMDLLDKKVLRILRAKAWAKLPKQESPSSDSLFFDEINKWTLAPQRIKLFYDLHESAATLLGNKKLNLPIANRHLKSTYLLSIGKQTPGSFYQAIRKYHDPKSHHILISEESDILSLDKNKLKKFNPLVIILNNHAIDTTKQNQTFWNDIKALSKQTKVVFINLDQAQNLNFIDSSTTVLQLPSASHTFQNLAGQILYGGVNPQGKLPITFNVHRQINEGKSFPLASRFRFFPPSITGIDPIKILKIDSIVHEGIAAGAMPGCQVFVAHKGNVIWNKNYGYHTFDKTSKVKKNHLYDIASITKVAATTLSAMKLYEQGAFKMKDSLRVHLPTPKNSTLKDIKIQSFFTHESGLKPNMPIVPYLTYRDSTTNQYDRYFCWDDREDFGIKIHDDFFFREEYLDSIKTDLHLMPVDTTQGYKYSDANFNIIQLLIEQIADKPLNQFAFSNFYKPLGLKQITYLPLKYVEKEHIVPTEIDKYWRMQKVHGTVHDETAALLGGIAGNAGLFSNAEDLATLFQMLLNKGNYGGQQFLSPHTIRYFTQAIHGNHRGLGFDKQTTKGAYACATDASLDAFGHTGFTGTCVWVDPQTELVYVFLSNRVYPSRKNKKLYHLNIRERIHQAVYDALKNKEETQQNITPTL